jgi:tetratricopeptide (TPR) repeat protein
MAVFQRIWNTIKPLPPVPQHEWGPAAPPVWTRIWDAIKPLAPVEEPREILLRRRWIFGGSGAGVLIAILFFGVFGYIKSAPMRAESAIREGVRLAAAGDNSRAIEHFNRAVSLRSDFAAAYLRRGISRQSLHQTDAAISDLAQALRLDPHLAAAHTAMGLVYRDRSDGDRAIAELTAALTIEPDEDAYYQRGQIYESLGQHEKAIADYNAAIGLLPNAPYVYRARATSELGLGDRDAARHDRSLALAIEHPGRDGSQ